MTPIGETLRRERIKRNLDLEHVSRELRISTRFLEAIEQERFDRLPGGVFTRSFVRQYARLLGLDEDELAGEVQRMMDPEPHLAEKSADAARPAERQVRSEPSFPVKTVPVSAPKRLGRIGPSRFSWSSSLPSLALVVLAMLVCSGVYTWWQRARRPAPVAEAPPQVAHAAPNPPAAQPPSVPPETTPAQPEAHAPGEVPSGTAPAPTETPQATPAAAPALAPVATEPDPNAPVRVQLTALEQVWVRVQADGKYLFSGTLEPNETRTINATQDVVLRLGNAGGVSVTLNGQSIGEAGPKGQVRTIQLTSGGFKTVPPKPAVVSMDPLER